MSTSPRWLSSALTLIILACAPAFAPADERLCRLQPLPVQCSACELTGQPLFLPASRPLGQADAGVAFVDLDGWKNFSPASPAVYGPSLTGFTSLAESTAEEVLVLGPRRASATSVDLVSGKVRALATDPNGQPVQWGRDDRGFWVMSSKRLAPSSPRVGPRAFALPAPAPLVQRPPERPLDTLTSGALLIPTSSGLFSFDPLSQQKDPFTILTRGTFTSATRLGTDVYAARCEPMPLPSSTIGLDETALVRPTSACEVVRFPETQRDGAEPVARLKGVVELAAYRDRVIVRTFEALHELSRSGELRPLYTMPTETHDAGVPMGRLGALRIEGDVLSFQQDGCLVTLDEGKGTVVSPLDDGRTLIRRDQVLLLRPANGP
jgi:hypothetical protein